MKTFILFLFIIAGLGQAVSYPISPRPLRKLIIESEYIIVGYVREIKVSKAISHKDNFDSGTIAVIHVKEVLQGKISEQVIEVPYMANMICPAPPHYRAGTTVIVFLNKKGNVYCTHALSYGVKKVDEQGVEAYKQRILEMQEIVKKREGPDKFMETVEWLVKCAENRATRWEGTFELSPQSDFMSGYSREEAQPFSSMLSSEQKERLKKVLLQENNVEYVDLGLADLVYVGNEREVHQLLLYALKDMKTDYLFFADSYMERLILLSNDPKLKKLLEDFNKISFDLEKEKEKRKIIEQFVAILSD